MDKKKKIIIVIVALIVVVSSLYFVLGNKTNKKKENKRKENNVFSETVEFGKPYDKIFYDDTKSYSEKDLKEAIKSTENLTLKYGKALFDKDYREEKIKPEEIEPLFIDSSKDESKKQIENMNKQGEDLGWISEVKGVTLNSVIIKKESNGTDSINFSGTINTKMHTLINIEDDYKIFVYGTAVNTKNGLKLKEIHTNYIYEPKDKYRIIFDDNNYFPRVEEPEKAYDTINIDNNLTKKELFQGDIDHYEKVLADR